MSVNIEGIVLLFNKGDCPMGHLHKKVGDDKYFFELLFPRKIAKLVIPVVAIITLIGQILLLFQGFRLL